MHDCVWDKNIYFLLYIKNNGKKYNKLQTVFVGCFILLDIIGLSSCLRWCNYTCTQMRDTENFKFKDEFFFIHTCLYSISMFMFILCWFPNISISTRIFLSGKMRQSEKEFYWQCISSLLPLKSFSTLSKFFTFIWLLYHHNLHIFLSIIQFFCVSIVIFFLSLDY